MHKSQITCRPGREHMITLHLEGNDKISQNIKNCTHDKEKCIDIFCMWPLKGLLKIFLVCFYAFPRVITFISQLPFLSTPLSYWATQISNNVKRL